MSELNRFIALLDPLIFDIQQELQIYNTPQDSIDWISNAIRYNVVGGKMNRGLYLIEAFKNLKPNAIEEEIRDCCILGWCVEILQALFLIADDIMDNSLTRRGKTCWYRLPNVGNIAINDTFILESCIYALLKKYFRHHQYYLEMWELFREVTLQTELGQLADLRTASNIGNLSSFTMERYMYIVTYKTAFYSFYLPVALAMRYAKISNESAYIIAKDLLIPLGQLFQVQDDYLDCYGDPNVTGKIGTDIEDFKCSWLIVTALSICNNEQKKKLDELYGRKDIDSVNKVKKIFRELDLAQKFMDYETEVFTLLNRMLDSVVDLNVPKRIIQEFAQNIYRRQK